jgi:hypothetical protein
MKTSGQIEYIYTVLNYGFYKLSGDIMSLLNYSDTLTEYVFYNLFNYCT